MTTTTWLVEGAIAVVDDFLTQTQVENFASVVASMPFAARDSFDQDESVVIEREAFMRAPFLFEHTEALHRQLWDPESVTGTKLHHTYAARIRQASGTATHVDDPDPRSVTYLYYANAAWERAWGGETILYAGAETVAVSPRPGRLLAFRSNLEHRAGAPAVDAPTERYGVSVFYYRDE